MFRLIEPSSGLFTDHTEGTFSRCAHCGIPNVYKSYDNKKGINDCCNIGIILSTTNKMQRYTIFIIIVNALHVSGGFSARNMYSIDNNKEYCI